MHLLRKMYVINTEIIIKFEESILKNQIVEKNVNCKQQALISSYFLISSWE